MNIYNGNAVLAAIENSAFVNQSAVRVFILLAASDITTLVEMASRSRNANQTILYALLGVALLPLQTAAQGCNALYGQCGGIGWTGQTCCATGSSEWKPPREMGLLLIEPSSLSAQ